MNKTLSYVAADEAAADGVRTVRAFADAIHELRTQGLLVLLRPKAIVAPAVFAGDVDVLYDPAEFAKVIRVALAHARAHAVSISIDQTARAKKRIRFQTLPSEPSILLELWPSAEVMLGSLDGRPASVPWRAVYGCIEWTDQGAALPADVEAALYLAHLYHKRKVVRADEVQARLTHYAERLRAKGGDAAAGLLATIEDINSGRIELSAANQRAIAALTSVGLVPRRSVTDELKAFSRRAAKAVRRRMPEQPVPLLGPDGVGKTTLTNMLSAKTGVLCFAFKNAFRYAIVYRALYAVLLKASGEQRNLWDERLAHLLLMLARVRWPIVTRRRRAEAGDRRPIIADRYFWDYFLRLRDATRQPQRIRGYKCHSWLAPTPRSAIVLLCRSEVIFERKRELTPEAIEALYDVYCDQLARADVDHALLQSTEMAPQQTVECVAAFLQSSGQN